MDKPNWNYWVIVVLGLFWNVMGSLNYITQTNPEAVAAMPEAYQTLIASRPAWATAAFAIAVFAGAVGCILLLMRRKVAFQVLLLSLLGVVVTLIHAVIATGFSGQVLMGTGMSVVVAAVLLWVARMAESKGWLR